MSFHLHKKGIRALGVSESFLKGFSQKSLLAGVVMRADMIVDGFTFSRTTVGGSDSTQKIVELYNVLERSDVNLIILNGCVISWYNVVDLHYLFEKLGLPLICVTYKGSMGLQKYFEELFPEDWRSRVEIYLKNGPRIPMKLQTGHTIFARFLGINQQEAIRTLNKFTLSGSIPEPLRIARLLARSIMKSTIIKH